MEIFNNRDLEEIVSKDKSVDKSVPFLFPKMTTMCLFHMPALNCFYPGKHVLECPKLKDLDVMNCDNLKLFGMEFLGPSKSENTYLVNGQEPGIQRPLFFIEKVPQLIPVLETLSFDSKDLMDVENMGSFSMGHFRKLKVLRIQYFYNEQARFPYWLIQRIPSLERLEVNFSSFKEVFPCFYLPIEHTEVREICPRMKELILWGLPKLEYICKKGFQLDPILQNLEILFVWECFSLTKVLPSNISFNHLTYLEIKGCDNLGCLSSISTFESLVRLQTLKIVECKLMDEVIESDGVEGEGEVEFGQLNVLHLENLPRLKCFCSINYAFNFPNLEEAIVNGCPRLQTFSVKASYTPRLNNIHVKGDEEKSYWEGNLDATIRRMFKDRVSFCNVECINLYDFLDFNDIKDQTLQNGMFSKLRCLVVHECEAWSPIISYNILCALHSLEELNVENCYMVESVFDFDGMKDKTANIFVGYPLKKLILKGLSRLKCTWSSDPEGIVSFKNLQEVQVEGCNKLKYVFPLSIARDLQQLEKLSVRLSDQLEVVAMGSNNIEEKITFNFPQITSIIFEHMPELKSFFPGMHTLVCRQLKDINIVSCNKLELLGNTKSNLDQIHHVGQLDYGILQPMFPIDEVPQLIPNVECMSFDSKHLSIIWDGNIPKQVLYRLKCLQLHSFHDGEVTFPYCLLRKLSTLEELIVRDSSFQELFPSADLNTNNKEVGMNALLKKLSLWKLPNLEYICKDGRVIDPTLERLEKLYVWECSNLVKLMPSSMFLNHLIVLDIKECNNLVSLMSLATAKSLVLLSQLRIEKCDMIEEIISNDRYREQQIEFCSLKQLELIYLPRFKMLCSINMKFMFPELRSVVVKGCPRMNNFTVGVSCTPKLHNITVDTEYDSERFWDGSINCTIQKLFKKKVALGGVNRLDLQEFPELKEIWHSQLPDRAFCNLRELVVEKCDFLSTVISINLLYNLKILEELLVGNCDNVEAVFDLEGNDHSNGPQIQESFNLRVITLNHLLRLKQVWKVDPELFSRFHKLQVVRVTDCQNLDYLFPCPVAEGLQDLKRLEIDSCNEMQEIIAKEDGSATAVKEFIFSKLTSIRLTKLPKLKNFYTVEWPRLRSIYTLSCNKLAIFTTEFKSTHETDSEDQSIDTQIPLFSFDKVIPNVEKLSLERRDAMKIWQGQVAIDLFGRLELLRLQSFNDDSAAFPCGFLAKMHNIKTLVVEYSSFKEIFLSETLDEKDGLPRLENLCLWVLPRLEYLCKEGFRLRPMLEMLEKLNLKECPLLTNIVPSSVSFSHLKYLEVSKCHGLIYLMTFTTAKSLVQLEEIKVDDCEMVKEILDINDNEGEPEIVLNKLKNLELKSLPYLENFCSKCCTFVLPSLIKVTVTKCPSMKVFSQGTTTTPKLQRVKVADADRYCWEGDLNCTIRTLVKDLPGSS